MLAYPLIGLDVFKADYIDTSAATSDVNLQRIITRATGVCETYTKRKLRGRSFTEYYDGDGTKVLIVDNFPIISDVGDISLYDDIDRDFASTTLFASTDFVVYKGQGKITLMYDASIGNAFQKGTQNLKIIYEAGYDNYDVITGYNDAIDFNEGGSEFNATLDSGSYTGADLATEIDTQLTAEGAGTYTVTFNPVTCKFTLVKSAGTFQLLWNSGTNTATSVGDLIGFATSTDDTGALTYTGDYSRPGVPEDLQDACGIIALDMYDRYYGGSKRQGKKSIVAPNEMGTLTYRVEDIPIEAKMVLNGYRRLNL